MISGLFQETNRLFMLTREESEQSNKKFDRIIAEMDRRMMESKAEADRRIQEEGDRRRQETDRLIAELNKQVGGLTSRWGDFMDGLVEPACETIFAGGGDAVYKMIRSVRAKKAGGRHMEIDLLVVNTDAVVLVEVKSKLKQEDVFEHINRLAEFKEFFPEYADKRILGAVAGIVMDENVDRFAMNMGLFVIVQSGETVQLANEKNFMPKSW